MIKKQAYYEFHYKDILQDVIDILVKDIPNTNYTTSQDGDELTITVNSNLPGLNRLESELYELGVHPIIKNTQEIEKLIRNVSKIYKEETGKPFIE